MLPPSPTQATEQKRKKIAAVKSNLSKSVNMAYIFMYDKEPNLIKKAVKDEHPFVTITAS